MLTYPAVQLLDVTGPVQVFASANDIVAGTGGARPYLLRIVSQGGQGVTATAGVALAAAPLTPLGETPDTLLVPGGEGVDAAAENPVLVDWVRQQAAQARRVSLHGRIPARRGRGSGRTPRNDPLAVLC